MGLFFDYFFHTINILVFVVYPLIRYYSHFRLICACFNDFSLHCIELRGNIEQLRNKEMKQLIYILLFIVFNLTGVAQTPGALITPNYIIPPATFLNPNGDNWVTSSGGAYIANDQDESELSWTSIPQVDLEPNGDLNSGGSCGTTDIMDDPSTGGAASYVLFVDPNGILGDDDEYMIYRLRIARDPGSGNFGFSVLMDIDGKFGSEDLDSIEGNPGFEVEVRVKNGGGSKALYLDDVNGATSGTNKESYSLAFYTQRSYALSQNAACTGKPVVFYDFIIPFIDLKTHFGMDVNTGIRLVGATSQNGNTVLGSAAADIAGLNDDNYANTVAGQDQAFRDFVNNQTPAKASDATGFGVLPVELGAFNGYATENLNILNWMTYMEVNNEKFVIERSFDGADFQPIGEVYGAGSTAETQKYEFADYSYSKSAFYRLKQVDFDGQVEYSKTIWIQHGSESEMTVSLQNNQLNLNGDYKSAELLLVTLEGRVVKHEQVNSANFIDLNDLAPGVYIVKGISNSGLVISEKIYVR